MDIEPNSRQWAKSTESKIQMFLDVYLIRSPIANVRASSQRLILSLFKKGNEQQRQRIMSLLQSRCQQLTWMGKASEDFLGLVKNILNSTENYSEYKSKIIRKILAILETIHQNIIVNPKYEFYSFASNLIDFGNQQFKPYLLQANGCLNCFGRTEPKSQQFKFQTCVQTTKVFNNKLQYVFKRIYDVKELTINLKTNSRVRSLTAYYIDKNKEYKKLNVNKFRPGDIINFPFLTLQGLMFEFDLNYIGVKKRIQCIFCDQPDDLNCACSNCVRSPDRVDISGSFRVVGSDQTLISNELCLDYQKIQDNINSIKNLHNKMQSKQKISLNFRLDEMVEIYQRIVNNLSLLHQKDPSKMKPKEDQNCFSCNYYQIVNIVKFLKQVMKKCDNIPLKNEEIVNFKENLRNCLSTNKIQSLKTNLLETLAVFIVNIGKANYREEFQNSKNKFTSDLISKVLIALKQKRNQTQNSIQDELGQIREFLQKNSSEFKIQDKIKIFTSYFLDWEFLSLVLSNTFNYNVQINRLTLDQLNELKGYVDFDMAEVFNQNLDSYLKAFLKIIPANIVPIASLDIADSQFLQYVDNKIPEIQKSKIEQSIICCPNPMIKLDMFASLPILIQKLPVKESIKVMNSLFPFRNAWNLNVIKACNKFDVKISQLPPEEQINLCLYGYCKSQQYLYIQKLFKLMVPQRAPFVIRLQAPINEIQINGVEYPYLPIRQVKSEDLQGDTIKALHDWIYGELVKMNQAMPLDIIVQKNIIDDMNLPVQLVYQNIVQNKSKRKIGDKQYDFFRVIYRIQGMFGQPKQRSIGNIRDQRLQTCISYASYFLNKFSEQYSKKIGLDVLIQILEQIKPGSQSDKKVILFEILSTLSMNEAICKKIVSDQYGDSIINATVRLMSFQNEKDAKITNFLLQLSSKVIDEANKQMINLRKGSVSSQYRKMSGNMDIQQEGGQTESEKKVKFVLEKIIQCQSSFQKSGNILYKEIAKRLIKLLPFCSKDEPESTKILFDYFDMSNWNKSSSKSLQNLFIFIETLSQSYMAFKSLASEKGVTNQIIKVISNNIKKENSSQIDEKKLSINKSQTQSAFQLLYALIQGDEQLQQRLFEEKLFENIYEISLILPQKALQIHAGRVPQHCGKIIKYFSEGKIVNHKILQYLKEKKKIEKSKFVPSKSKKFQQMKRKQRNIIEKNIGQKKFEEEDFIVCSTCYEGYKIKKDILGFYIYLSKNQIPLQNNWWKDGRRLASFTSATYLTPVHFDCHMKAYETSDQKIGRSEWDGALIKNSDVLCNGWIPIKGNKTTIQQFARVQRKYFEKNKNGNYWNVVNDVSGLLERLSNQFDFAKETKGSSSFHNCKLIPILIGFACHMIERAGGCNNIEQGVNYLMEHPPSKLPIINYLISYSIFTQNYEWFEKNKQNFLKWIISYKNEQLTQQKRFQLLKPHIIYLKLAEQIFQIIHKPMSQVSTNTNLKIFKQIDLYLCNSYQQVFSQFQKLSQRYKQNYLKITNVKDIQL